MGGRGGGRKSGGISQRNEQAGGRRHHTPEGRAEWQAAAAAVEASGAVVDLCRLDDLGQHLQGVWGWEVQGWITS